MKFNLNNLDKETTNEIGSPSVAVRPNPSIDVGKELRETNTGARALRFDSVVIATPVMTSDRKVKSPSKAFSLDQVSELAGFLKRLSLGNSNSSTTSGNDEPSPQKITKEVQSLGKFDPKKGSYSMEVLDNDNRIQTVRRSSRIRS